MLTPKFNSVKSVLKAWARQSKLSLPALEKDYRQTGMVPVDPGKFKIMLAPDVNLVPQRMASVRSIEENEKFTANDLSGLNHLNCLRLLAVGKCFWEDKCYAKGPPKAQHCFVLFQCADGWKLADPLNDPTVLTDSLQIAKYLRDNYRGYDLFAYRLDGKNARMNPYQTQPIDIRLLHEDSQPPIAPRQSFSAQHKPSCASAQSARKSGSASENKRQNKQSLKKRRKARAADLKMKREQSSLASSLLRAANESELPSQKSFNLLTKRTRAQHAPTKNIQPMILNRINFWG